MSEQTFEFPCTQCGFCCLSEACPVARDLYHIDKHDSCPALRWHGREAACGLVEDNPGLWARIIGVGKGCCMLARVFIGGKQYDFAALPPEAKSNVAEMLRAGKEVPV